MVHVGPVSIALPSIIGNVSYSLHVRIDGDAEDSVPVVLWLSLEASIDDQTMVTPGAPTHTHVGVIGALVILGFSFTHKGMPLSIAINLILVISSKSW